MIKEENSHIAQGNHTDGLPNAEPNSRRHTPIQPFHPVLRVDVLQRRPHSKVFRSIRIHRLTLHFYPDHLDRLIPRAETTTQPTGEDLLKRAELLSVFFVRDFPDRRLRQSREAESRAPIRGLADSNGVDAAIDTSDAFLTVDVHEGLEGARRFDARGGHLVLCDLHGFHAGAEAHGGVGLGDTADHAAADSTDKVRGAEGFGVVFGF